MFGIVAKNRGAKDSAETELHYRDMTDAQLRREAHSIAPEPWTLSYLTEEELREWEGRFKAEKLRRREGRPPKRSRDGN